MKDDGETRSCSVNATKLEDHSGDPPSGTHREEPHKSHNEICPEDPSALSADAETQRSEADQSIKSGKKKHMKSPTKSSPNKKIAIRDADIKENDGVVIGNFHAFETDEQKEVLLPRLVNGCSRVIIPVQQHANNNINSCVGVNSHEFNKEVCEEFRDTQCGICGASGCCQRLANKKTFLVIYCLTTVLQGMFYTYFASGLSTIQKLYGISSQVTGIIMSATEIGQIGGSLFLAYYGGSGHRPRWIAWGMLLFAGCTFLCAVPHFLFRLSEPTHLSTSIPLSAGLNSSSALGHLNTCSNVTLLPAFMNSSVISDTCSNPGRITNLVLALFFVALVGVGIGQTAVVNLGIPYIDDNVDNKDSAMYFGEKYFETFKIKHY